MVSSRRSSDPGSPKKPRAKTPEAREHQMINLAFDLAELQLREGTASSPVIVHYLKLGTQRNELELEKVRRENLLLEKKVEQIESGARIEELYSEAIVAMREYRGDEVSDDNDH